MRRYYATRAGKLRRLPEPRRYWCSMEETAGALHPYGIMMR